MSPERVEEILKAEPFQPFRIVMSNGKEYEIRHPEMAWVTKRILYVGATTDGDTDEMPEYAYICTVPHINTVEYLSPV